MIQKTGYDRMTFSFLQDNMYTFSTHFLYLLTHSILQGHTELT